MIEIIPAIDLIDGKCVRLSQGEYDRCTDYNLSPEDMAKRFADHGLTRIHVVDLDGAKASSPRNLHTLEQIARINGVTAEWGGGIKTGQALKDVFNAGATYAIIGSIAAREPQLMTEWLQTYGGEKLILGADVRNGKVAVSGWRKQPIRLTICLLVLSRQAFPRPSAPTYQKTECLKVRLSVCTHVFRKRFRMLCSPSPAASAQSVTSSALTHSACGESLQAKLYMKAT